MAGRAGAMDLAGLKYGCRVHSGPVRSAQDRVLFISVAFCRGSGWQRRSHSRAAFWKRGGARGLSQEGAYFLSMCAKISNPVDHHAPTNTKASLMLPAQAIVNDVFRSDSDAVRSTGHVLNSGPHPLPLNTPSETV